MQTKLSKLTAMWEAGDYDGALALASSFPQLGAAKGAVKRERAMRQSPAAYEGMGYNYPAVRAAALAAIATRYGFAPTTEGV